MSFAIAHGNKKIWSINAIVRNGGVARRNIVSFISLLDLFTDSFVKNNAAIQRNNGGTEFDAVRVGWDGTVGAITADVPLLGTQLPADFAHLHPPPQPQIHSALPKLVHLHEECQ